MSLLVFVIIFIEAAVLPVASSQSTCEDIGLTHYCSNVTNGRVRFTHFPNLLGQHSVSIAKESFHNVRFDQHTFTCSSLVDTFVCSLFFPLCINGTDGGEPHVLHPCRNLCTEVADNECAVQFAQATAQLALLGVTVPEINCSTFPTFFDSAGNCIAMDGTFPPPLPEPQPACSQSCNSGLLSTYGSNFGGIANCSEPCEYGYTVSGEALEGVFTLPSQKVFFWVWLGFLSTVCLAVSLFTCVSWAVTYNVYRYPERPIIYICACYVLIALSYFIHVCAGPSVVCSAPQATTGSSGIADGERTTVICAFTFCLHYFFSVASWTWWVIIVFLWFLNAAVRINRSTLERPIFQFVYHLVALIIPTVFTIVAMATHSYGGNSITRLCEISTQSKGAQIGFVLVPQLAAILICIVLLLFGHIWMLLCDSNRASTDLKEDKNTQSPSYKERSMYDIVRTDVFSVLFLIHLTVAASVSVYQYQSLEKWQQFYVQCTVCRTCSAVESSQPLVGVFVFKVTVELLIGSLLVFWLKPKRIRDSWKKVCFRLVKGQSLPMEPSSTSTPTELRTPSTPTSPTWSPTSV